MADRPSRLRLLDVKPGIISKEGRELLEKYAGVPSSKIEELVLSIQERAWAVSKYVCIGEIRFLDLYMSHFPGYSTVLQRLKERQDEVFLDLGCCFGQDLRKLVFDGAPLQNIYGAELRPQFVELSYELFKDRERFASRLVIGDILNVQNTDLAKLIGKVDIIYASAFIHLFDWNTQIRCCLGIVRLIKAKSGSFVYGRQAGRLECGHVENIRAQDDNKTIFMHNTASFSRLWEIVGEMTGTTWEVNARLVSDEATDMPKSNSGHGRLYFSVTRK